MYRYFALRNTNRSAPRVGPERRCPSFCPQSRHHACHHQFLRLQEQLQLSISFGRNPHQGRCRVYPIHYLAKLGQQPEALHPKGAMPSPQRTLRSSIHEQFYGHHEFSSTNKHISPPILQQVIALSIARQCGTRKVK
jgi:hypothetical protein